ncbi:hypothetical protein [Pendulispora albinea]|uniref:Uncharacterized protein n=1 Tax=Pendulispora albinea TaxID=2741071 RepID=A0ABZ2M553_9BACT
MGAKFASGSWRGRLRVTAVLLLVAGAWSGCSDGGEDPSETQSELAMLDASPMDVFAPDARTADVSIPDAPIVDAHTADARIVDASVPDLPDGDTSDASTCEDESSSCGLELGTCTLEECPCEASESDVETDLAPGAADAASADAASTDAASTDAGPPHTCLPKRKPLDGPFKCPAKDMPYNHGPKGWCPSCQGDQSKNPLHFDCDDYAMVCANWGIRNGYNVCQMTFEGTTIDPKQKQCENGRCRKFFGGEGGWAHVINIAEFTGANCKNVEGDASAGCFCMVEPQNNSQECCWPTTGTTIDADPPKACWDKLCAGWKSKDCKKRKIWCTDEHSPNPGELPFYVHEDACKLLSDKCKYSWKKVQGCKACQGGGGGSGGVDAGGSCVGLNSPCTSNDQCSSGTCLDGRCNTKCTANSDCQPPASGKCDKVYYPGPYKMCSF